MPFLLVPGGGGVAGQNESGSGIGFLPGQGPQMVPSPTGYFSLLGGRRASSYTAEIATGVLARYYPFYMPVTVTLSGLGGDCYQAAATSRKMAIFRADPLTNAVGDALDYVEVTLAATQWRSGNFQNGDLELTTGWYWYGTFQSNTEVTGFRTFDKEYALSIGQNNPTIGSQEARAVNFASSTPTSYATWPAVKNTVTFTEDNSAIPWIIAIQA